MLLTKHAITNFWTGNCKLINWPSFDFVNMFTRNFFAGIFWFAFKRHTFLCKNVEDYLVSESAGALVYQDVIRTSWICRVDEADNKSKTKRASAIRATRTSQLAKQRKFRKLLLSILDLFVSEVNIWTLFVYKLLYKHFDILLKMKNSHLFTFAYRDSFSPCYIFWHFYSKKCVSCKKATSNYFIWAFFIKCVTFSWKLFNIWANKFYTSR